MYQQQQQQQQKAINKFIVNKLEDGFTSACCAVFLGFLYGAANLIDDTSCWFEALVNFCW